MVFSFFKRKKQYQLPSPADAERDKFLPPPSGVPHDEDEGGYSSRDVHQESASQKTNEQSSLESLLFSGTTVVIHGMRWELVDIHLVGKPTRNVVAGHGLGAGYSSRIEKCLLPVGIVYFSEKFRRDVTEDYRIQCMIHMALKEIDMDRSVRTSEPFGRPMWELEKERFFTNLESNLDDLESEVSGMELRIYHSYKTLPEQIVKKLFPQKFKK